MAPAEKKAVGDSFPCQQRKEGPPARLAVGPLAPASGRRVKSSKPYSYRKLEVSLGYCEPYLQRGREGTRLKKTWSVISKGVPNSAFPSLLNWAWDIGEEGLGKRGMMAELSEDADGGRGAGAEEEQQLPIVFLV